MTKTASKSFLLSSSQQNSPYFAVLMYALYGHPKYFKFKQKYQQYGLCFRFLRLCFYQIKFNQVKNWKNFFQALHLHLSETNFQEVVFSHKGCHLWINSVATEFVDKQCSHQVLPMCSCKWVFKNFFQNPWKIPMNKVRFKLNFSFLALGLRLY